MGTEKNITKELSKTHSYYLEISVVLIYRVVFTTNLRKSFDFENLLPGETYEVTQYNYVLINSSDYGFVYCVFFSFYSTPSTNMFEVARWQVLSFIYSILYVTETNKVCSPFTL